MSPDPRERSQPLSEVRVPNRDHMKHSSDEGREKKEVGRYLAGLAPGKVALNFKCPFDELST